MKQIIQNDSIVADIGCGTGILTKQLLDENINCIGIEPNIDMYNQAKKYLKNNNATLINASAENTLIEDKTIDLIVVAQALHWFNLDKFIYESKRILKEKGKIAIIYNNMDKGNPVVNEFLDIHRKLCPNYKGGFNNLKNTYDYIYDKNNYEIYNFENNQSLTYEQFIGYTFSLSYSLNKDDKNYTEYINSLKLFFQKYSSSNNIFFPMTTTIAYGKIK